MGTYKTKHGIISISGDQKMEDTIAENGAYMFDDIEACFPFVSGTVVDVGAHVGLWSIPVAHHVDCVHAFEPNEAARKHLIENIKANEIENITVHEDVVGDPGKTYHTSHTEASGSNFFIEGGDKAGKTLDSEIIEPVSFIKIDVEGMEPEVLEGAKRIIKENQPYLFIEVNPKCLERMGKTPKDISDKLPGYSFYRYDNGWRHIWYLMPSFFNVLAVPKGKTAPKATSAPMYILAKVRAIVIRLIRSTLK